MSDDPLMYRLVFMEGPDKGRRVVIRQAAAEAGSDPDVRIPLDDPAAQEHHAVFIRNHGEVHVETGMGAEPFMRHGKPLGREPLCHGDVLELGGLRLQFQIMEPLIFYTTRRPSRLQWLTLVASLLVVTGQVGLLGFVLFRGHDGTPLPTKAPVEMPAEEMMAARDTPDDSVFSGMQAPEAPPPGASPDAETTEDIWPEPERPAVVTAAVAETGAPDVPAPDAEPAVVEDEPTPAEAAETSPAEDVSIEEPVPAAPVVRDPPVSVAPTAEEVEDLPRRIRITDVAREKFQEREGYEEVRAARVVLHSRRSLGKIDPSDVHVEVTFYDRDVESDEVAPTRVPLPEQSMDFGEQWESGEEKSFIAVYGVPEGFRAGERAVNGGRRTYYGYVVRLFYRGALEDVYAFPSTLLTNEHRPIGTRPL